MAEHALMAERAEAPDRLGAAAHMRADAAVHRHFEALVHPVAGPVAGAVGHEARREEPHILQPPALHQHLVEGRHALRGRVTAAAGYAGAADFGRVALRQRLEPAALGRRVHVHSARVLRIRQADEHLVLQPERRRDLVADEGAEVPAGDGLDQRRSRPVRGPGMVVDAASGRPFGLEADDGAPPRLAVLPGLRRHVGVGKAALVRQQFEHALPALAVGLEARQMHGDRVGEAQPAVRNELPDRRRRNHLGIGEQQPERAFLRILRRVEPRPAEAAVERQPPVPGDGDLGAGIAPLGDMGLDRLDQPLQRPRIEAERLGVRHVRHARAPRTGTSN